MTKTPQFNKSAHKDAFSALKALSERICDDSESVQDFAKSLGSDSAHMTKVEGFENKY